MAYRFTARSEVSEAYRFVTGFFAGLVAAASVIESVDRGDGSVGTYHEATEAEVLEGVTFGAGGALTGTLEVEGGSGDYPDPANVLVGDTTDTQPGTYEPPLAADVLDTATFGDGGLTAGTYHAPDAAEVIDTAVFGPASATAGTWHAPDVAEVIDTAVFGAASADAGTVHLPDAAEVIDTAVFGAASATAGTWHAPDAAEVIDTATYGAASAITGTVHQPEVAEVIDTAVFGPASALAGTWHAPDAAEVISTAVFGPASGIAGTFNEAARNTDPGVANVTAGVTYKIANVDKTGIGLIGITTMPGVAVMSPGVVQLGRTLGRSL